MAVEGLPAGLSMRASPSRRADVGGKGERGPRPAGPAARRRWAPATTTRPTRSPSTSPLGRTTTTVYQQRPARPSETTDPTGRFTRTATTWPAGSCPPWPDRTPATPTRSPPPATTWPAGRCPHRTAPPPATGSAAPCCAPPPPRYDAAGPADPEHLRRGPAHLLRLRRRRAAHHRHPAGRPRQPGHRHHRRPRLRPQRQPDPDGRRQRQRHHLHLHAVEPARVGHRTVHRRPIPTAADRTWTTVYDAAGRPSRSGCPEGSPAPAPSTTSAGSPPRPAAGAATTARSLDYDPLGRITSATSPAGNHTYTWTDRGLLATASGYGGTATYTYDGEAQPHRARSTPPARPPSATTTPAGSPPSSTRSPPPPPPTPTTPPAGSPPSATAPATPPATTPTTTWAGSAPTPRPQARHHHGRVHQLRLRHRRPAHREDHRRCSPAPGANTYTYDGLGRVTSWLSPGGTTTTYGYDAASNRTTVTTPAGTRTSTFDDRNRLTGTTGAGATGRQLHLEPARPLTTAVQGGRHDDLHLRRVRTAHPGSEARAGPPSPSPTTASTGPPNAAAPTSATTT